MIMREADAAIDIGLERAEGTGQQTVELDIGIGQADRGIQIARAEGVAARRSVDGNRLHLEARHIVEREIAAENRIQPIADTGADQGSDAGFRRGSRCPQNGQRRRRIRIGIVEGGDVADGAAEIAADIEAIGP